MTDDPRLLMRETSLRSSIRASLADWAFCALEEANQVPAKHQLRLIEELEALARGETDRLMVLMPPGSGKSTYGSILFPAWWFARHPRSSVIATSHTAGLAEGFGKAVRRLIESQGFRLGYRIAPGERAGARWRISPGGEYFATGVRGPITGRRADLAVIDDPVKSRLEAESLSQREHLWNWYRSDLTTRLKPGARVLLIMTRWHEDDLAGRLLAREGSQWRYLRLPALAEEDDPLGRAVGEALWPGWESQQALERKRNSIGEREWSAMFQQSPRPLEGALFKVACFDFLDVAPTRGGEAVRAWDLASTASHGTNDPDWTVGVKLMREESGRYIVLDVVRQRGSPRQIEDLLRATAKADGRSTIIGLPQDPGQAGKAQVAYLSSILSGYRVVSSGESGSKATRAGPVASQVEAGNIALVRANWNHAFIEELRDFPVGRKDDQVDAFSRAFLMLAETETPARRIAVEYFAR
ncbi:MAG: phage terminase large subunit [Acetobacteraceae bacterium]|nr:phage terminase large subunit [Acetobacteraceae bacterium]